MYMDDPWRNDFSDDGEKDDEDRRLRMIDSIREEFPNLSTDDIDTEICHCKTADYI